MLLTLKCYKTLQFPVLWWDWVGIPNRNWWVLWAISLANYNHWHVPIMGKKSHSSYEYLTQWLILQLANLLRLYPITEWLYIHVKLVCAISSVKSKFRNLLCWLLLLQSPPCPVEEEAPQPLWFRAAERARAVQFCEGRGSLCADGFGMETRLCQIPS